MTTETKIPREAIVRYRNAVGPSLYRVVYDFGAIGARGSCFCEIEPFPNVFHDEPVMVPSKALEVVPNFSDRSARSTRTTATLCQSLRTARRLPGASDLHDPSED